MITRKRPHCAFSNTYKIGKQNYVALNRRIFIDDLSVIFKKKKEKNYKIIIIFPFDFFFPNSIGINYRMDFIYY